MKIKFTGPLAEPIYREDWDDRSWLEFSDWARTEVAGDMAKRERWDAASRARIAAEEARIAGVKAEKLALLASQFEAVDARGQPDWRVLAERLAEVMVPGLQVRHKSPFDPKPGRPKGNKTLLAMVVEQLRRNERLSIFAACCELSKRPGHWHKANPRSLEQRYNEGMREWKQQRQPPSPRFWPARRRMMTTIALRKPADDYFRKEVIRHFPNTAAQIATGSEVRREDHSS